ncbi:MAG: hypothetical protein ACKVOE_03080 [Rickettsiales bacterium]
MLKLNLSREDHWIELDKGIRVLVHPFTTYIMQIAQNNVKKFVKFPDPETPEETKNARLQTSLTEELAIAAIVDWEGVYTADGSKIAEVNEDTVTDLMTVWYLAQKFFEKYTSTLDLLYLEGNGSGSAANGISAAAQNTAEDATNNSSPVP